MHYSDGSAQPPVPNKKVTDPFKVRTGTVLVHNGQLLWDRLSTFEYGVLKATVDHESELLY